MEPKGRPKAAVDRERLVSLRSLKFSWAQIGSLMGISSKTAQRRAKQWNIETYTTISDSSLDDIVRRILSDFPNSGEVMVKDHLLSQKVRGLDMHAHPNLRPSILWYEVRTVPVLIQGHKIRAMLKHSKASERMFCGVIFVALQSS